MTATSSRARAWRFAAALVSAMAVLPVTAADDEHVAALERSLSPAILVKGETPRSVSLAERMGQLNVAAVSIAYFDHGRIEWARAWGYADKERRVLATRDTLFQAGSISKPVTAVAVLRLVDRGQISLDQNVNERLTSWKLPDNEFTTTRKVTARNILNHTAGTTVEGFPGYERGSAAPSLVRVLDGQGNTEAVRVFKTPGESWRYSGGGYTVLQLMLTDVTGLPFPELMQREVLGPMGLRASTYEQQLPELMQSRAAVGYLRDGSRVVGDSHEYPEMAAAGLWTTPSDLARFAMGVQAAKAGRSTVLARATAQAMLKPGQNHQGLGPVVSEDGLRFGHQGADFGFQAQLTATVDEGPGVAIMTNADTGGLLAHEIILTLARDYGWPGLKPEERTAVTLAARELRAVAGRYLDEEGGLTFQVMPRDGALRLVVDGSPEQELVPESADRYFVRQTGETLTFEKQGDAFVAVLPGGRKAMRIEQ